MTVCYKCDYCGKVVTDDQPEELKNWIFIMGEKEAKDDRCKYWGLDAIIPNLTDDPLESNLSFLIDKTFCSLNCFINFLIKHLEGEK
jgi:hypothetical protein